MNWYKTAREKVVVPASEVGYNEETFGPHHGEVQTELDTWNYPKGYRGDAPPMPLPKKLYHVTLAADKILQEGFKTFKDPAQQTFGGHGTYVSLTSLQNAQVYADGLKDFIYLANLPTNDAKMAWIRTNFRIKWGIADGLYKMIEFRIENGATPDDALGEAMGVSHIWSKSTPRFPMFVNGKFLLQKFRGMSPNQVKIIEVETQPLEWHPGANIFDDVDMSQKYTYNSNENEWRIWDPKLIKAVRVL